jgi:DNA mismatch repair protein MutL
MPRIKILPEILSNKIAAGEVVERPASVVKELVENAIDAKSTRITVEVKKGGKSLIRVSDNGIGMERDDSLLALERFATSKIQDEKGLFSIATLGFRGEALPSIASVSDMEMVTKSVAADVGTRIVVKGGQIKDVSDVGAANGTMITVNRLFYNTPARRKFLKTDQTEMGHVSDMVTQMALSLPPIHFRFFHNGRELGNWGSTDNPRHRIEEVLKGDVRDCLYDVDHAGGHIRVNGLVASPEMTRATSKGQHVFVNGRFVRDKVIQHAVMEGYAGRIVKGQFPVVVLFLTLPLDEVDVNVHPTKSSVRFRSPRQVHDVIVAGIAETMRSLSGLVWAKRPSFESGHRAPVYRIMPKRGRGGVGEPESAFLQRPPVPSSESAPMLWEEKPAFASSRVIGQLLNSYIVCESEEGLVLVDQHAAHERVVFETLKTAYGQSKITTQGMLIPEKLELTHREASILDSLLENLRGIGLEIEHFGGTTYLIRAVPVILAEKSITPLVMEIIDKVDELGFAAGFRDEAVDACLMLVACHGAIRANTRLSEEEMKALLRQMDQVKDPTHCPHGRPTVIRRTLNQLEKDFKRIV